MANERGDLAAKANSAEHGNTGLDFTVSMLVRRVGEHVWRRTVAANPGDRVEYRVGYDNTSQTRQNEVTVRVSLPQSIAYVSSSTFVKNATHPIGDGLNLGSDDVAAGGINIGNYAPDSNAFVLFRADVNPAHTVADADIKSTARAIVATAIGTKENTATVHITSATLPEVAPAMPDNHKSAGQDSPGQTWFLSHASADAEFARELRHQLLSHEITGWLAQEDIGPSENYAAAIVSAIERADRVIVILSEAALNSVHVQREVSLALRFAKALVPLYARRDDSSWRDLELPASWLYWLEIAQVLEVGDAAEAARRVANLAEHPPLDTGYG